jgi:hypothetical protein
MNYDRWRQRCTRLLVVSCYSLVQMIGFCLIASRCFALDPSVYREAFVGKYPSVLGFDLTHESAPVAAILINKGSGGVNATVNLVLPFRIKQPGTNEAILLRSGIFDRWTIMTYSDDTSIQWPQQISFFPVPEIIQDPPPQNSELRGSLYFHNMGQIWRFLYRYPDPSQRNFLPNDFFRVKATPFDAIAVAIPDNARRIEVRGRTAIPEHIDANRYARFYPSAPTLPNEPFLEIQYELPLTVWQTLVAEYVVKFMGGLTPLLGLWLLHQQVRRPRLRVIAIMVTAVIYLCLSGLLIGYALKIGEAGYKMILELALFGITGVVALIVFYIKGESLEAAPVPASALPTAPAAPPSVPTEPPAPPDLPKQPHTH